jgi:hypothetical protein
VLFTHWAVTQGLPVALMIVVAGPATEMTLTPGNMRRDSRYVPGWTRTVPPPVSLIAQMPSWILQ